VVTFFFVRHASTDAAGILCGRAADVHLSSKGLLESEELAKRFRNIQITSIWSSPLERASETANSIAKKAALSVFYSESFNEVNYGEWTGRSFDSLASDPRWHRFNVLRDSTRIPGGEHITEVQKRVLSQLEALALFYQIGNIVVVTHAEPIRLVVAHWLNSTGYLHDRLEISPASVTILRYLPNPLVLCINNNASFLP
jgi:broad specificity phosphatase PhoE